MATHKPESGLQYGVAEEQQIASGVDPVQRVLEASRQLGGAVEVQVLPSGQQPMMPLIVVQVSPMWQNSRRRLVGRDGDQCRGGETYLQRLDRSRCR